MRARVVAAALIAATCLSDVGAAHAGANDDAIANPLVGQSGPTHVDVGIERTDTIVQVRRGGAGGVAVCSYEILAGVPAQQRLLVVYGIFVNEPGPEMRYAFRVCRDSPQPVVLVAIYRAGDPTNALLIDALAAAAYDRLEIPVLTQQGAPRGEPAAPLVVKFPTWLWVNAVSWTPITADAEIPGARVVATATPVRTQWDPGSGDPAVTCGGPGTAYDFDVAESSQSTACSITYRHSSAFAPKASFTMRLTVVWQVDWVCEPACGSGALPDFEITSLRTVRVAEIQALNTRSGN